MDYYSCVANRTRSKRLPLTFSSRGNLSNKKHTQPWQEHKKQYNHTHVDSASSPAHDSAASQAPGSAEVNELGDDTDDGSISCNMLSSDSSLVYLGSGSSTSVASKDVVILSSGESSSVDHAQEDVKGKAIKIEVSDDDYESLPSQKTAGRKGPSILDPNLRGDEMLEVMHDLLGSSTSESCDDSVEDRDYTMGKSEYSSTDTEEIEAARERGFRKRRTSGKNPEHFSCRITRKNRLKIETANSTGSSSKTPANNPSEVEPSHKRKLNAVPDKSNMGFQAKPAKNQREEEMDKRKRDAVPGECSTEFREIATRNPTEKEVISHRRKLNSVPDNTVVNFEEVAAKNPEEEASKQCSKFPTKEDSLDNVHSFKPRHDADARSDEEDDCRKGKDDSSAEEDSLDNVPHEDMESSFPVPQGEDDYDPLSMLVNSIWNRGNRVEEERAPIPVAEPEEELPLLFTFGVEEPEPVEKSVEDEEIEELFAQTELALKAAEIGSYDHPPDNASIEEVENAPNAGANRATLCERGQHYFILNEEIGLICKYCPFISQEIKDIMPPFAKRTWEDHDNKYHYGPRDNLGLPDGFESLNSGEDTKAGSSSIQGTAWELIPGVRSTMYTHQQEGFEFLWRNIVGSCNLDDLKKDGLCSNSTGCIISHAPGTGKTRLTICFLVSYMKLFPNCKPVVIVPASILRSWEDEFRKWNLDIPFHNLNDLEFSGKEDRLAVGMFLQKGALQRRRDLDLIRMVKLYSWSKDAGILGMSYSLYERLTGERKRKEMKNRNNVAPKKDKTKAAVERILLEWPGLLVLDEGHTPRNKKSSIWKAISKVKTEKRIILSGTPFQNNFEQLFNTMSIVRPTVAATLSRNKNFRDLIARRRRMQSSQSMPGNMTEDNEIINVLKDEMAPFVHVHEGSILKERLPGLIDRVLVLEPTEIQRNLIQKIERHHNNFDFEHKVALVSTHPYLYLHALSENEELIADGTLLDPIRLNPNAGVKTRFLMELIRLSDALNEKVLVFSQYIHPLDLIKDQIASVLGWKEGREILQMQGRVDQKCRHSLMTSFNDPNSDAKVLLASTRACSEGINLVGASRVVLLDVVWNPSVERQAISRAYRLGQKKVVYTYHLITSGTTEWDKYCRQTEKDRISQLVFSSANKEEKAAAVSEDKLLYEMVNHEKLKDIFVTCQQRASDLAGSFRP